MKKWARIKWHRKDNPSQVYTGALWMPLETAERWNNINDAEFPGLRHELEIIETDVDPNQTMTSEVSQ